MRKWAVRLAVISVVFACGASPSSCGCNSNNDNPEVLEVSLCSHKGATAAPVNAPIYVTFNSVLDPSTVDPQSVTLWPAGGDSLACELTVNGTDLTVQPKHPLQYGADYVLTLRGSLEGVHAAPLGVTEEFPFTTQAQPLPVDVPPFDVVRHGVTMNGLWANEKGALAVGEQGVILLSTDEGRFVVRLPHLAQGSVLFGSLQGVWASRLGVAYISGSSVLGENRFGAILRLAGGSAELDSWDAFDYYFGVHGISDNHTYVAVLDDVYLRGEEDHDLTSRYKPTRLSFPQETSVVDVWAYSPKVVYAAGFWGIYRGVPKSSEPTAHEWEKLRVTSSACTAISGLTDHDVVAIALADTYWVHGQDVEVVHRDGFAWSDICWATEDWAVQVGRDDDGARSVLFHDPLNDHDGMNRTLATQEYLNAVAAWTVDDDRYAMTVGEAGVAFTLVDTPEKGEDGIWTSDSLAKRDAQGEIPDWTDLSGSPELLDYALYGIRDGAVVEGNLNVASTADLKWRVLPAPGDLIPHQLFCLGEDDIWVTGSEDGQFDWFLARYNGNSWTNQWFSSMDVPHDIWAADEHNVFVACDHGTVYRLGGGWFPMSAVSPPQHLYGVWGSSADSVWVCGAKGTISHYESNPDDDSFTWTQESLDAITNVALRAIHGSGILNIVAVGDKGTVLRYDGTEWADFSPPPELGVTDVDLTMVWAMSPQYIWAASPDGTVLHWDGLNWIKWTTGMPSQLNALWGGNTFAGGDLWIGGEDDLLLRHAEPPAVLPLIERE